MNTPKRTEEQHKDHIFDIFSKCRSETASGRLQVYYPALCEQIYIWYKDYLSFDVDKMGLEIIKVINRFTKDENISKIPNDKDGFFKYLNTSIKREKAGYYREFNENETIKIPKEKKRKLREVEDFIRMKESQLGRKLTLDEKIQGISKWFKKQEYIDLLNLPKVSSFSCAGKNGEKDFDVLDFISADTASPLDEYIQKINMETYLEAVKSLLEKKQARSRDCYRELFTLYCIENRMVSEKLTPVLDNQILEDWYKHEQKPKQYEIYQKFHPLAQKSSAEAMASKNLSEFLKKIETCLRKK